MSCAIDTNVLVGLFAGSAERADAAVKLLTDARAFGALVVSAAVYAELLAAPKFAPASLDAALRSANIAVDWELSESVWRVAGSAFGAYSRRRRRSGGGLPRRMLTDFVIGAHALRCGALATHDRGLFASSFPRLKLLVGD